MKKTIIAFVGVLLSLNVLAKPMQLDTQESNINFVSVKNNAIAEVHYFRQLSGDLDTNGNVSLVLELASIDSGIEIRDERMKKSLFETGRYPVARINAQIDPILVDELKFGERKQMTLPIELNLHNHQKKLDAKVQVIGLSDGRIEVLTTSPIIIQAADFGLDTGVGALQSVAKLNSIATAVPVNVQLLFAPKIAN